MTPQLTIALFWLMTGITAQTLKNVALRGRATQSSLYYSIDYGYLFNAINAIDGNLNSFYKYGSCSSTNLEDSPWWRVDLLDPHKISYIAITSRGDCCGDRLNGGLILVGNSEDNNANNNPSCAEINAITNGATQTFQCNGMIGRYVNIILPGRHQYLQLCEVQVFGVPENTDSKCDK
ncbi:fucolectin-4-like [Phyllobates terribilis]|uniref:fucolectin-4-like n=1 Tax=Phyllobates terribilis TaxID=111132 RepID=UPI003CCB30F5